MRYAIHPGALLATKKFLLDIFHDTEKNASQCAPFYDILFKAHTHLKNISSSETTLLGDESKKNYLKIRTSVQEQFKEYLTKYTEHYSYHIQKNSSRNINPHKEMEWKFLNKIIAKDFKNCLDIVTNLSKFSFLIDIGASSVAAGDRMIDHAKDLSWFKKLITLNVDMEIFCIATCVIEAATFALCSTPIGWAILIITRVAAIDCMRFYLNYVEHQYFRRY